MSDQYHSEPYIEDSRKRALDEDMGSYKKMKEDHGTDGNYPLEHPESGATNSYYEQQLEEAELDPNSDYHLRFLIRHSDAGYVIGKGGHILKEIREKYNIKIRIPDSHGAPERLMMITTSKNTFPDVLNDIISRLVECVGRGKKETDLQILIPQMHIGSVIGNRGERIKSIRSQSGANIKIFRDCLPNSTERAVMIQGSHNQLIDAILAIANFVWIRESENAKPGERKDPIRLYDPCKNPHNAFDDGLQTWEDERFSMPPQQAPYRGRGGPYRPRMPQPPRERYYSPHNAPPPRGPLPARRFSGPPQDYQQPPTGQYSAAGAYSGGPPAHQPSYPISPHGQTTVYQQQAHPHPGGADQYSSRPHGGYATGYATSGTGTTVYGQPQQHYAQGAQNVGYPDQGQAQITKATAHPEARVAPTSQSATATPATYQQQPHLYQQQPQQTPAYPQMQTPYVTPQIGYAAATPFYTYAAPAASTAIVPPQTTSDHTLTQVTLPDNLTKALTGTNSQKLKSITEESKCAISIGELQQGSDQRIINIVGSQDDIKRAQKMLQNAVQQFLDGK